MSKKTYIITLALITVLAKPLNASARGAIRDVRNVFWIASSAVYATRGIISLGSWAVGGITKGVSRFTIWYNRPSIKTVKKQLEGLQERLNYSLENQGELSPAEEKKQEAYEAKLHKEIAKLKELRSQKKLSLLEYLKKKKALNKAYEEKVEELEGEEVSKFATKFRWKVMVTDLWGSWSLNLKGPFESKLKSIEQLVISIEKKTGRTLKKEDLLSLEGEE